MENNKPPRKPRKKKQTNVNSKQEVPVTTPQVTAARVVPLTPEENEQFLKHINSFLKKKEPQHRENLSDYKILQSNIGEFLESYITFGYTFTGQRVVIQHYPTPKDKDALLEFLKNIFVANASKDSAFLDDE